MPEIRRKYDPDFKAGAVRIVNETRKPIAQVAKDLGINEGTLANWVTLARIAAEKASGGRLTESERAELVRLRKENAELAMERDDASMVVKWWVSRLSLVAARR